MYLYEERKEDRKQTGIVSKTSPSVLHSAPGLYDVRIKYKSGRQKAFDKKMLPSEHSDKIGFNSVVQRCIIVASHDLSVYPDDYIYRRCVQNGLINLAERNYSLVLKDEDFIQWIGRMKSEEKIFRVRSYKELNREICLFIQSNMPQKPVMQSPAGFPFSSFTAGDMRQDLPDLNSGDLFRPSSPVITQNNDLRRMRTEKSVSFCIADGEKTYHVGGTGRFMSGVGTYSDLMLDGDALVRELNALFSGQQLFSSYRAANDLYALIIGVEGCARSAHNIALARIFFNNYSTIKQNYPNKSLYELAEMFLTFVQKDGASLSKNYVNNQHEIQMLYAHCKANHVPFTAEDISAYLTMVVEDTIRKSGIQTIYPLYCEETFAVIARALREGSLLSSATDEEIRKFIEAHAKSERSEQHTLYDWETISGIWYLHYYLEIK